jgi:MFS family permease
MRIAIPSRLERVVGGPARARVVVLFACALALESADLGAIGAAAPQLESAFQITNTQLGLLAAVSTFVGAVATVPVGALTDRVRRVRLLTAAVVLWGASMAASAVAPDYSWLLLSQLGLGAVTAAAGPAIASMTGDLFPPSERGKIYGYILSGELLGAAVGFVVSGSLAGALTWRWAFGILAIPAVVLAYLIRRLLPEPARGGQSQVAQGAQRVRTNGHGDSARGAVISEPGDEPARRAVERGRVRPLDEHVLREDPNRMTLRQAITYVLSIRTNRLLILASAIGYFFFAGMRTFALVFVRGHFGLGQSAATAILFVAGLGALAGVLVSGPIADRMTRRGRLTARVLVGAISYLIAAAVLVPALLFTTLFLALPALVVAGAGLAGPNPPLDAARLDIMPARLWGRAEGVRTLLRQTAQAAGPLLFGLVADLLSGGHAVASQGQVSAAATRGLQEAFLIMLVPLTLNGLFLLHARHSYPADVATAIASERAQPAPALRGDDRGRAGRADVGRRRRELERVP